LADAADAAIDRHGARRLRPPACVWRGRFGGDDSLRVVNDGFAETLEERGHHVVRRAPEDAAPTPAPSISHVWPPVFDAGSDGPAIAILPWEFGHPPRAWVTAARTQLDRVVVPSRYVRDGYVAGGMPPGVVEVVPQGADLERFTPDGEVADLPGDASCTFLFVGGTIARKGIDLLLDAWKRAFAPGDDVRLVIKDFGAGITYATADDLVGRYVADPSCAPVVHITDHLEHDGLAALYRAADAVVLPYRGEGFCLPALEALACGRPVVHTAIGPTSEFVPETAGWALGARRADLTGTTGKGLELAGTGYWHEVDPAELADTLRAIAADPADRRRRAAAARPAAEAHS
jgi:glycosyltransferase involved in cell wall biosynthesis